MSAQIIFRERKRHVMQFSGLALAAGVHQTGVSGQISFPYRILKVKLYFLDNSVPDLRYYVLVGTTPSGSATDLPEGTSIFAPYTSTNMILGSQGARIMEPLFDVNEKSTYLKVHAHNNGVVYACDWAAEITIERLT